MSYHPREEKSISINPSIQVHEEKLLHERRVLYEVLVSRTIRREKEWGGSKCRETLNSITISTLQSAVEEECRLSILTYFPTVYNLYIYISLSPSRSPGVDAVQYGSISVGHVHISPSMGFITRSD